MRRRNKVLYSGFRFRHHNPGSGYDAVVGGCAYVNGNELPYAGHPESSFKRHLNFLCVDLVTLARGLAYDTVHYFYPENTAYLSPWALRLLGKRIVFTLHLAEREWLDAVDSPFMRLKQWSLRSAHALAVLSRAQEQRFRREFGDKTVQFVPHGFTFGPSLTPWLEVFATRCSERRLLVVGQNYRDFDLLERILSQRGERAVTVHLVGTDSQVRERFADRPDVIWHGRLSRVEYERLLIRSFGMLLPLSFATANNALLEAYACCLPVFATRIPGITDYAVDAERTLFGSAEEFWQKFDALAELDPTSLREYCLTLRNDGEARFAWPQIRTQLAALY